MNVHPSPSYTTTTNSPFCGSLSDGEEVGV